MKTKVFITISFLLLLVCQAVAQPPQAFRYQAIARDASGNPMGNATLKVHPIIRDLTATGIIFYAETHTVTTNTFGLFNLAIGRGAVTNGDFELIDWGSGAKFIEVEIDFGAGYISLGSSELLSVPYALFAPSKKGDIGPQGIQGLQGIAGLKGDSGIQGLQGIAGIKGDSGIQGLQGVAGLKGDSGIQGLQGIAGIKGDSGTNAIVAFADFYAMMPGNNASTIAVGAAVDFPQNGPSNSIITRVNSSQFNLPAIGTYMVSWQVSVDEPGQLILKLNATELNATLVGRATATSQITGNRIITTTLINSVLSVVNPTGNSTALTITPNAGGANAVSSSIVIMRIL